MDVPSVLNGQWIPFAPLLALSPHAVRLRLALVFCSNRPFLGSLSAGAAWLGIIEGISDGLSNFANLGSGFYTGSLPR
jgi:hypothetical protein